MLFFRLWSPRWSYLWRVFQKKKKKNLQRKYFATHWGLFGSLLARSGNWMSVFRHQTSCLRWCFSNQSFFLLLFDVSFNMTQPAVTTGVFTVQTPQQLESSPRKVWAYPHCPPPWGDPSLLDPEPSSSSSWFSAHVKPRNDDHRNFRCFSPDFKKCPLLPTVSGQPAALMFGIGI